MTFFPILKKIPIFKKKKNYFEDWNFHSVSTHKSYMVMSSFILMARVCVIANFLLTKNDIIVHNNKFPNLGVYPATFPNMKGPRAPFQICKKIPEMPSLVKAFATHTQSRDVAEGQG